MISRQLKSLLFANSWMTADPRNTQKWPSNTQLSHLSIHAHAHVQIVDVLSVSVIVEKSTINLKSESRFFPPRQYVCQENGWDNIQGRSKRRRILNELLMDEWKSPGCPQALSNSALQHVASYPLGVAGENAEWVMEEKFNGGVKGKKWVNEGSRKLEEKRGKSGRRLRTK